MEDGYKPKKLPLMQRLFGGRKDRRVSRSKTIVKIKTVGEIPPITETRKALGDGNTKLAVVNAFMYAKNDFMRFFGVSTSNVLVPERANKNKFPLPAASFDDDALSSEKNHAAWESNNRSIA